MFSRRQAICATAVALCALLALADHNGKPHGKPGGGGGDPPPGGAVYFDVGKTAWAMDADGADKTALPIAAPAEPSHDLHGSRRWFLQERNNALIAVREDGVSVQLTTDPDMEVAGQTRWNKDDSAVSWVGRRWDAGTVAEAGIYVAWITFDAAGDVVGLAGQPAAPVIDLHPLNRGIDGEHDWAPDGTRIAYKDTDPLPKIFVADLTDGGSTFLAEGGQPNWSPDGARIAYQQFDGIHTIKPDGSGDRRIIDAGSPNGPNAKFVASPRWSPTSAHLVYYRAPRHIDNNDPGEIWRATAAGKDKVNLTADLGPDAQPLGWR
jgi:hypothetical protein